MRAFNGDWELSFETKMVLFYELFWAQSFVVYNFLMLRCRVDQVSQMQKLLVFKETIVRVIHFLHSAVYYALAIGVLLIGR